MKQIYPLLATAILFIFAQNLRAQGNVGIGAAVPGEKLDVSGAIIIRTDAASSPPVAGTIRYNTTDGMHDGYQSTSTWRRLENDVVFQAGNYYTVACGASLSSSIAFTSPVAANGSETPFCTSAVISDRKSQHLYLASELVTAGYCAGLITSIGFNVTVLGATSLLKNAQISLKNTVAISCTASFATGMTVASAAANKTLTVGINSFACTGFSWDGTSNLLVEICWDNTAVGTGASTITENTALATNYTCYKYASSGSGCSLVAPGITAVGTRPVLYLTGKTVGATLIATNYFQYNKGIVVGSPSIPAPYLSHGPGSVTAEGVYDEDVLLSDYVFDKYFDNKIQPQDFLKHGDFTIKSLDEMATFMEVNRHLPTIDGRDVWRNSGQSSLGNLSSQLWVTSETQAIYIAQLAKRISNIEQNLNLLLDK